MTLTKYVFRQDAPCLQYAALGDTAVRVITLKHIAQTYGLDAIVVPQANPKLVPLWQAAFGENRIILNPAEIPTEFGLARVCRPTSLDWAFGSAGWNVFESVMWENGFFDTNRMRIIPPLAFRANHQSNRVMIYPAEHTDGNRVLNSEWWISTCRSIRDRGWGINLLGTLDHHPLRDFFDAISPDSIYPPTIDGLRDCTAASSWAIGGSTGPTWVLLMSDIQQIVVESKRSPHGYWHFDRCQPVLGKRLRITSAVDTLLPLSKSY